MIFRDIPVIRIGSFMLNIGGADANGQSNFVPFKTILAYLFGHQGLIITGVNIVGNIALLVPVGFLVAYICKNITWKKFTILSVVTGLLIESMQVVLNTGIFDIDDVILNALGVMVGYWAYIIISKWIRLRKYKNISITAIVFIAVTSLGVYAIYADVHRSVNSRVNQSGDLCNGTGGNGEIVGIRDSGIVIKQKDGTNRIITFSDKVKVETQNGPGAVSDLKVGARITLVGDGHADGSFVVDTIVVCG